MARKQLQGVNYLDAAAMVVREIGGAYEPRIRSMLAHAARTTGMGSIGATSPVILEQVDKGWPLNGSIVIRRCVDGKRKALRLRKVNGSYAKGKWEVVGA